MAWFVISIASVVEVVDGQQYQYPINEDLILYQAHSKQELADKIQETINICNEVGQDGIIYYDEPAINYYIGSRQTNYFPDKPSDGTWVYHSVMKVKNWQDVELLADGKAVKVQFLDISNKGDN